jgi:hypothetical protein
MTLQYRLQPLMFVVTAPRHKLAAHSRRSEQHHLEQQQHH